MGGPLELHAGVFLNPSSQARLLVASRSGDPVGGRLPGQEPRGGWEGRSYWELWMKERF